MLRNNSYFLIFAFFFLAACGNNSPEKINVTDQTLPFPAVFDTIGLEVVYDIFREKDPIWCSTGEYHFNYIGKYNDTIYTTFIIFNRPLIEIPPGNQNIKKEVILTKDPFEKFQKYHIQWGKENPYNYSDSFDIEIRVNRSEKVAGSYPVMLTNKESDTIQIGYGEILPIIMEAKDKEGNWRPIQQPFTYLCGNGIGTIILPPNEIVITLAPVFKGDYKTQLRLKYGKNYSEPFGGSISYSQFEYKKYY